jgi:cytidylate kinase
MIRGISLSDNIRPILGAMHTVPLPPKPEKDLSAVPAPPFLTISRQPGAGAWTLARQLVDALNRTLPAEQSWTCWDRELVEKVATDLHLSARLIHSLEDRERSWMSDFLESLSFADTPGQADEAKVYARIAETIRALAHVGRVVIVGMGAAFATRRMRGGIAVRLVAPFEHRVNFMAREYQLTPDKAAARVKELEHNRAAFYRRYWANEPLGPETFALTINTAEVDMPTMIDMLTGLVKNRVRATV